MASARHTDDLRKKIAPCAIDTTDRAAKFLKSIAHPDRLKTLCYLIDKELSVADIESQVGASQSSVSQYLGRLKGERIVTSRREGRKILYKISDPTVFQIFFLPDHRFCNELDARYESSE